MKTLQFLFRNHPFALSGFVLGLAVAIFFVGKLALNMLYFNDPRHQNQAIEGWMTLRYVSMSYKVPPERLKAILELPDDNKRPPTMAVIAANKGMTLETLTKEVTAAAETFRAEKKRP